MLKGQHPSLMPLCNEPHPCCPQKRTVICDPILCQPLNCTHQVHPEELCCPICEGTWGMGWGVPCENKMGVLLRDFAAGTLCNPSWPSYSL